MIWVVDMKEQQCVKLIEKLHQTVVEKMEWYAEEMGLMRNDLDYDKVRSGDECAW